MRGWSRNTRRAFRSDLALWGRWCRRQRVKPAKATPALVAAWIRALAGTDASEETPGAMATIERHLVHVGWAYRMAGLTDPTSDPLVKFERKAARKAIGASQTQARAIRFKGDIADLDSPAAGVCVANLLKACRRDALGPRDVALLRVAYDTGARRSELVAIDIAHIDGPDADGAGVLFIPSSKTDQVGEGLPAIMKAYRWRDARTVLRYGAKLATKAAPVRVWQRGAATEARRNVMFG